MLVLGRKTGQGLFIGRGIRVTVLDMTVSGLVRLAIEAPVSVVVSRDDVTAEEHYALQMKRESEHAGFQRASIGVERVVLGRREGDGVYIGRDVRLLVSEVDGELVRLGIAAPRHVAVSRDDFTEEQHLRMQRARERGENPADVLRKGGR